MIIISYKKSVKTHKLPGDGKRKKKYGTYLFSFSVAVLLSVTIAWVLATGSYANTIGSLFNNRDLESIEKQANEGLNGSSGRVINHSLVIKEIQGIHPLAQMPELPSGCEITTLTMLLRWAGVDIDKQTVAEAVPKGPMPSLNDGFLYGGNPNSAFIGNPFSGNGLGVYHKPIAELINSYLPGKSVDVTGQDFESILSIVDDGRPVIVWSTIGLQEPKHYASWSDKNGNTVKWIMPEHTFLLAGYSGSDVIVYDSYSGKRQSYPIQIFKSRWESMGRQAVTVSKEISGKIVATILVKPIINGTP